MKHCFFTLCMVLAAIGEALGQNPSAPDLTRVRIDEISTRILTQKKDLTRIDLYRYFSEYFAENNIYPTDDAIDLIEAYNKESKIDEVISGNKFKPIQLPDVSEEAKTKMNAQIREITKSKLTLNSDLKVAIDEFKKKLFVNYFRPGISREFRDSVNVFGNKILPRIYKASAGIDSLQVEFFVASLQQVNTLISRVWNSSEQGKTARAAMKELMDDFFSFEIPVANHAMEKRGNNFLNNSSTMHFSYADYKDLSSHDYVIDDDPHDLPNANVYVYTRGADGKWSQAPKPDAYNVYYGANGFKYRLTPGCDTLSFFRYHPTVPASTLPVILPRGSFCFVLQDITTHRLYLRPDINLRDNKVIDDKRLVKLCFKVEN